VVKHTENIFFFDSVLP